MDDSATLQALHAIAREWDKAEGLIKKAERTRSEVTMAAVNELRYAGRRLVDALHAEKSPDPVIRAEMASHVAEAKLFCIKAQHDAIDATILFVQKAVQEYESEFGRGLLAEKYPQIFEIRAALDKAGDLVVQSREDRTRRVEEYERLATETMPGLIDHYRHMHSNRDLLLDLVRAKSEAEARAETIRIEAEARERVQVQRSEQANATSRKERKRDQGVETVRYWMLFAATLGAAVLAAAATVGLERVWPSHEAASTQKALGDHRPTANH